MAVGISVGVAFGRVINSLVNDVLMPPIGKIIGQVDFSRLYINLSSTPCASLAEAQKAGAPTINYGIFLNETINFLNCVTRVDTDSGGAVPKSSRRPRVT